MNKTALLLSCISVCAAIALAYVMFFSGLSLPGARSGGTAWTEDDQRELAGRLKGAGLAGQAIREYEEYARTAALDKKQLANLSYSIGKMYMDAGEYEQALSWFYRVEIADPQTPLKAEIGPHIVTCLERSGKYSAAEYALNKRTSHDEGAQRKSGTVVAEISGEKIYLEDINETLDGMPEWMRKQFEGKQAKAEFAKKYIADELLYRKAIKLAYDKDPDIRKKLKTVEKELMVNRVLESELKDKIKADDDDVKNYFAAHSAEYEEKEAVKVSLIKAGMKEIADKIIKEIKGGKDFNALAKELSLDKTTAQEGGRFPGWVRKGQDDLGIGSTEEVSSALFGKKKGDLTQPLEVGGAWYLFRIDETRDAKMPAFDEVKDRVKNDYSMQKLKASYQSLLDQILKSSDVKLYLDAVTGEEKK